ncbi:SMI1/KNR4 family protein [Actinoplanes sp. NPDC000266]
MRAKLDAAAATPGEHFGAGAHGFRLGPPLPESDVTAFEHDHGVRLPDDYRAFITTVGNGGPGRWGGAGGGSTRSWPASGTSIEQARRGSEPQGGRGVGRDGG